MSSPLQRALRMSAVALAPRGLRMSAVALAPRGLRMSAVALAPRGLRMSAVALAPRGLRLAYVPPVFDQYRFQRVSLDFVAAQQAPLPPCPAPASIKDLLRTHRRRGFIRAFGVSSLRCYVASIAPLRHDDCGGAHWYGGACPCAPSPQLPATQFAAPAALDARPQLRARRLARTRRCASQPRRMRQTPRHSAQNPG